MLLLSITSSLFTLAQSTGCSVIQETGNLNTGYYSDFTQYQGMDDIFIPANECWSVNQVKANFFQNVSSNTFEYYIDVYTESQTNPGTMEYVTSSYSGTSDYTATSIQTYTTGFLAGYTKYQLNMDLGESIDLCGGATGKTYWVAIYSENTSNANRTIWEIDTLQANNYGLNLRMYDPGSAMLYTATTPGDFVFELNYRMFGVENTTVCNSYDWMDGNTYTNSVSHVEYLIPGGAASGCDSVVFLNLTVNYSGTSTDTHTACGSYTWMDGNTYTASNNTAQFVISNGSASGCDSVITLNLTINPAVTATITENGIGTLQANTAAGYQYQWLNCTTNQLIPNQTSATYTATENGSYAVIITSATNCADTSACYAVSQLGIESNLLSHVTLYPNPTTGRLFIDGVSADATVEIYDLNGKLLTTTTANGKDGISLEPFNGKVFLVKVHENEYVTQQRVVKW